MISTTELYSIADSLQIDLQVSHEKGVRGRTEKIVQMDNLKVKVPLVVVSSFLTSVGSAVLCRSLGNLCFLIVTGNGKTRPYLTLFVLDAAKFPGKPEEWFEKKKFAPLPEAILELKEAVVASYRKTDGKWEDYSSKEAA